MNQAQLLLLEREREVESNVVLNLVFTSGLSAYNCEYIALAQKLDTTLVTSDRQIIKAFNAVERAIADFLT